eukprot:TRINITY_DN2495_c0_g1_i1.p1 TRINITY_DN2495_c0_g1~~TRINITY_DN2495_c0_g1_i1.p1  ORF type:complete len:580 (+),score=172.15 TRINITY_DN2495_c0_g1_i1:100-1839(+)
MRRCGCASAARARAAGPNTLTLPPPTSPDGARFCDAPGGRCVLDAGFHSGQDARRYLAAGHRVVAVEANPRLVAAGRAAFADAIAGGRLVLLGAGLISHELPRGTVLPFYRSTESDVWSSFAPEWGCRHADGSPASVADTEHCRAVAVPTTTCDALIRDYGTPYMLKVDIEGQDTHCIASLKRLRRSQRPPYASVENVTPDHIRLFTGLGYHRFKAVDQGALHTEAAKHAPELLGHSGPFGDNATDAVTGRHWQPASTLTARLPLPSVNAVTGDAAWYDLHAALPRTKVEKYLRARRKRLGKAAAPTGEALEGKSGPSAGEKEEEEDEDDAKDDQEEDQGPSLPLGAAEVGASDGRAAAAPLPAASSTNATGGTGHEVGGNMTAAAAGTQTSGDVVASAPATTSGDSAAAPDANAKAAATTDPPADGKGQATANADAAPGAQAAAVNGVANAPTVAATVASPGATPANGEAPPSPSPAASTAAAEGGDASPAPAAGGADAAALPLPVATQGPPLAPARTHDTADDGAVSTSVANADDASTAPSPAAGAAADAEGKPRPDAAAPVDRNAAAPGAAGGFGD